MRKILFALGGFVALLTTLAAVVYAVPSLHDEAQWQWAAFKDRAGSYATYLREQPHGRHATEATRRYDQKDWQVALGSHTIAAFERYLHVHADGRFASDAHARIESINWQTARRANTMAAYEHYLAANPTGAHAAEARTLHWNLVAGAVISRVCENNANRQVVLYRAPSPYRTDTATRNDPSGGTFYQVRLEGSPGKGYEQVAQVRCNRLRALGVSDLTPTWVLVASKETPSVRGWAYAPNALLQEEGTVFSWSKVPRFSSLKLTPHPKGLPDLAFEGVTQTYHAGQQCPNENPNVFNATLRNRGPGVGPSTISLKVALTYTTMIKTETIDTTRVLTFPLARPLLPGETLAFYGLPASARIDVDPNGEVREADEGNNGLSLGELFFTCH